MFHYGFAVACSILYNQDNLALRPPEPLTVVLFAHASVRFALQDYFNNHTRVSEANKKVEKCTFYSNARSSVAWAALIF